MRVWQISREQLQQDTRALAVATMCVWRGWRECGIAAGAVSLDFTGYEDDPRPMHQIRNIRELVAMLLIIDLNTFCWAIAQTPSHPRGQHFWLAVASGVAEHELSTSKHRMIRQLTQ